MVNFDIGGEYITKKILDLMEKKNGKQVYLKQFYTVKNDKD